MRHFYPANRVDPHSPRVVPHTEYAHRNVGALGDTIQTRAVNFNATDPGAIVSRQSLNEALNGKTRSRVAEGGGGANHRRLDSRLLDIPCPTRMHKVAVMNFRRTRALRRNAYATHVEYIVIQPVRDPRDTVGLFFFAPGNVRRVDHAIASPQPTDNNALANLEFESEYVGQDHGLTHNGQPRSLGVNSGDLSREHTLNCDLGRLEVIPCACGFDGDDLSNCKRLGVRRFTVFEHGGLVVVVNPQAIDANTSEGGDGSADPGTPYPTFVATLVARPSDAAFVATCASRSPDTAFVAGAIAGAIAGAPNASVRVRKLNPRSVRHRRAWVFCSRREGQDEQQQRERVRLNLHRSCLHALRGTSRCRVACGGVHHHACRLVPAVPSRGG